MSRLNTWTESQFVTAMRGVSSDQVTDDLYEGYGLEGKEVDMLDDACLRAAVKTSYGQRKGPLVMSSPFNPLTRPDKGSERLKTAGYRPNTGRMNSSGFIPPITACKEEGESSNTARPITAVRPVGFSSKGAAKGHLVDMVASPDSIEYEAHRSIEQDVMKLEQDVIKLVEDSVLDLECGKEKTALEKARKAVKKEKILQNHREIGEFVSDASNPDITHFVLFNLGTMLEANCLDDEAISTYRAAPNKKEFAGGREVSLGNIYYRQEMYKEAIPMYRKSLDQIPEEYPGLRAKILQNIGNSFIQMKQYSEAIVSFEHIMKTKPSYRTAFNLILCYYGIGVAEKMKKSFVKLLSVAPIGYGKAEIYNGNEDLNSALLMEAIRNDELNQIEDEQLSEAERCVLQAAKLIAPRIQATPSDGFIWCVEEIKKSECYHSLAPELEITKAMMLLRHSKFDQALQTLNVFEKKKSKIASTAANNLSFYYFITGKVSDAERYADQALAVDSYNYHAHVNKGNVAYVGNDYELANSYYKAALDIESGCLEALYNQGLAYKALGDTVSAEASFLKADCILRSCPEILYQLAILAHEQGKLEEALEIMQKLSSVTPMDPGILKTKAIIYESMGDLSSAYECREESFKCLPSDVAVLSWLADYYFQSQYYEKAMEFFEKCILVEDEVKWYLAIGTCQQKNGMYQEAYMTYRVTDMRFPKNVICLEYLVKLSRDLGLCDLEKYEEKLKKAKEAIVNEQKKLNDKEGSRYGSGRTSGRTSGRRTSGMRAVSSTSNNPHGSACTVSSSGFGSLAEEEEAVRRELEEDRRKKECLKEETVGDAWYDAADLDELVPDSSSVCKKINTL